MTPKQIHRMTLTNISKQLALEFSDGIFVECGVKQGTSSVIMAKNLKLPGVLFDTWTGFPHFSEEDVYGKGRRKKLIKRVKDKESTYEDCVNALKKHKVYSMCKMVRGDILKTVPTFFEKTDKPVVLLHVDTDLFEPAKTSLDTIWKFISVNGMVVVHDYGDPKWPGITKCVDEFIQGKNVNFVNCKNMGFYGALITKDAQ